MEKSQAIIYELPAPVPRSPPKKSVFRLLPYVLLPVLLVLTFFKQPILEAITGRTRSHGISKSLCEQPDPLFPSDDSDSLEQMYEYISTSEFEKASIKRHSGAVQIPTQSFDDMGKIGEDYRWDAMYPFAEYLKDAFPLVHEYMEPEVVNTHGLIFTWKGSDKTLKPLLLMSHQDVVPVGTLWK